MQEASKTRRVRGPDFEAPYLHGRVIDIGSGNDLVVPHAEPFDQQHGDANEILRFREAGGYDAVHSAHCLEHMHRPADALAQWWGLVKPGGYFVVVVPHEDLYEQGIWPSLFNSDHKNTFRLGGATSWSPVSHDLRALVEALPAAEVISAEVHDNGYDHTLQVRGWPRALRPLYRLSRHIERRFRRRGLVGTPAWVRFRAWIRRLHIPVDQTFGDAMAQIQVVARKGKTKSSNSNEASPQTDPGLECVRHQLRVTGVRGEIPPIEPPVLRTQ